MARTKTNGCPDGATPERLDALLLESSRGGTRSVFPRGRVVAAFYEPRDGLETNLPLKRALRSLALGRSGLDVLAIGDVAAFDFEPARSIVRRVVRMLGARHDLEILLDWSAALARPPFDLVRGACNVFVVGRDGQFALRSTGALPSTELARVLSEVERLLDA